MADPSKTKVSFSVVPFLIGCVVALVACALAYWQYQRGVDKQQRLDGIALMAEQGELSWRELNRLDIADKTGVQLSITGTLLTDKVWWLTNQVVEQQLGYDLIVAMKMAESEQLLLLNLGWYAGSQDINWLPDANLPNGEIELTGIYRQGDLSSFHLSNELNEGWPKRINSLELAQIQGFYQQTLHQGLVYVADPRFGEMHYQAVVLPPERHFAYMLQWLLLALAAMAIFGYLAFSRQTIKGEADE